MRSEMALAFMLLALPCLGGSAWAATQTLQAKPYAPVSRYGYYYLQKASNTRRQDKRNLLGFARAQAGYLQFNGIGLGIVLEASVK